ncbi:MAG TPA: hypothetical protein VF351_04710 [Actinomycetota bacterium]
MSRRALVPTALVLGLLVPALPAGATTPGASVPANAADGPWAGRSPEAVAVTARFAISRDDGNDVKGDLDLASMKISRGKSKDTLAFSTHDPVSNASIDPDNGNFVALIDTNQDDRFDFGQYVFFASGRLRGVLLDLRTSRVVDRTAPASRSSATAFRTSIVRSKIDSPGTYRFVLFAYSEAGACSRRNPCVDTIPNRGPMIALDHRAPTATADPMERYAGDVRSGLTSPLTFRVADDPFGTGVKRWTVQRRAVGGANWVDVRSGSTKNTTVSVPGAQGQTYDVRVLVVDKQKNTGVSSTRRTTFPFDDRNAAIAYAGVTVPNAPAGAFLTTTTSLELGATATLSFTGAARFCVMGGPVAAGLSATADLVIDTVSMGTATEDDTTPARERVLCVDVGAGAHTAVLTGSSAVPFELDGLYVAR